ncbi:hypothetical protein EJ08DRAFT_193202 [Tothia fuscella]|uniref:DNA-directed RNA polymerase III subunit n=1 Tax=Tothia fuscella TaxID=1048955 RepID=A0A9P4TZ06_9PEZI|nr:hypothetical protein EJ08DRAFT_193202 [Tothia fuscella]
MSRGGRGGGRGRGGRRGGFGAGAGGEPAPKFVRRVPETFPPTSTPVTPSSTLREREIIRKYRDYRAKLRKGPYYTVLSSNASVTKSTAFSTPGKNNYSNSMTKGDGFSAVRIFSYKYREKPNNLPMIRDMTWLKDFLPTPLYPAVAAKAEPEVKKKGKDPAKNLTLEGEENEEEEGEEEQVEAEVDENWEEDEEDGDDYNAEQYFDNGEDDDGEDDDGGGGDYE